MMLMGLAVAATSGMFLAGKRNMTMQAREVETTQTARAALDMMVRDLRLGGACLPVTGDFISLDGVDNGTLDEIYTRTGLTRPDLSCISNTVPIGSSVTKAGANIPLQSTTGFTAGMRAYIRAPNGVGEFFVVNTVSSPTLLTKSATLSQDYPATSGVYGIDERHFFIQNYTGSRGVVPELMMQIGTAAAQPFAVGIEQLDIQYQLSRNCPPCDIVSLPANDAEWAIVQRVLLNVTARSEVPDETGKYYRRTLTMGVKPRNLLPQ